MLFRLIVLLMGGLFLAMYFAPDGDRPARPARTAAVPESASAPAPEVATEVAPEPAAGAPAEPEAAGSAGGTLPPVPEAPAQDVAPAPAPLVAPAETAQTPEAAAPEDGETADPFAATDPAAPPADPGVALPELGQLGGSGNSDALDLSNSVRDRNQVEGVTPPPVRPGSPAAQPDATAGAAAPDPATAGTAPARLPVGPVTGPRAQVTATSVNLRASPSTTASVVGRVNFGDTVVVTQQNAAPGWTGIRNPRTGEVAYVSSQFLRLVP